MNKRWFYANIASELELTRRKICPSGSSRDNESCHCEYIRTQVLTDTKTGCRELFDLIHTYREMDDRL